MSRKETIRNIGSKLQINTEYDFADKPFLIFDLIQFLQKAENEGAMHIKITGQTNYDDCEDLEYIEIQPIDIDLESDIDYNNRLQVEKYRENELEVLKKEKEITEYKRLKEKYGNIKD